jgi:serine/threonine-protein kinase HipA
MVLKMNGKDDRLRRADSRAVATTGIKAADADAAIDEIVSDLAAGLEVLALPDIAPAASPVVKASERMRHLVKERLDTFA